MPECHRRAAGLTFLQGLIVPRRSALVYPRYLPPPSKLVSTTLRQLLARDPFLAERKGKESYILFGETFTGCRIYLPRREMLRLGHRMSLLSGMFFFFFFFFFLIAAKLQLGRSFGFSVEIFQSTIARSKNPFRSD